MPGLDARLAEVARRQRMLITMADVVACGGDRHNVHTRVASGRWRKVEEGVYLINGAPYDWATRQQALTLAGGPGALGSHFAAARVLGLAGFETAPVEVSVPRGRNLRRSRQRTHESTDLDRCRRVEHDGVWVTDPDRTILDLARYLGVRRLTAVVEDARRRGLVTWSSLIATLVRHARQGRHGVRRLRAVIVANADRDEITDTDVELLLLVLIRQAGLREPVLHHRVTDDHGRFVAEVDFAYPDLRIAIEVEGDVHGRRSVRNRDSARRNDLELEGWLVLVFSNDRVKDRPTAVLSEIRAAIARRTGA